MPDLILRSFQSPGDIVMLTAAVRDLHAAYPGRFRTDVRTSADALWLNNPHLTSLRENEPGVAVIDMHYPLVHQSNQRPYHFIHGYAQYLEEKLQVRIPVTRFQGDIHLSAEEKRAAPEWAEVDLTEDFWVVVAGGKYDFTAKWWDPAGYQKVVDHFRGKIRFVQCGEEGHWHPRLDGVIDLVGKTSLREFVRLVYHAAGVLCPVTFAMHLAAAIETRPGRPARRPCVVVAGGREPAHWEAYPHHQYISTAGMLPCCAEGGCWKSRCQLVGDGDDKDRRDLCEQPVQIRADLRIGRCMQMITAAEVIRRVEMYVEGRPDAKRSFAEVRSQIEFGNEQNGETRVRSAAMPSPVVSPLATHHSPLAPRLAPLASPQKVLIQFCHGLGDAVQLTCVLQHLRKQRPWELYLQAKRGKHSVGYGYCARVWHDQEPGPSLREFEARFELGWFENYNGYHDVPNTKVTNCLREVFRIEPERELLRYKVQVSDESLDVCRKYLESIGCTRRDNGRYSAVFLHYQGNTSVEKKNLPHEVGRLWCEAMIEAGYVPVVLDWDGRSPLPDNRRIFNPGIHANDLWGSFGSGDAERITALVSLGELFAGIDSGPQKCAGATDTPAIGLWTRHSPVQFFDLCPNFTHLVVKDFRAVPPCNNAGVAAYFVANYDFETYEPDKLAGNFCELSLRKLGAAREIRDDLVRLAGFWCPRFKPEQSWVIIDDVYLGDAYKTKVRPKNSGAEYVIDLGANIGCFTRLWHERNPQARIIAVEVNPQLIETLTANAGEYAEVVQAACRYDEDELYLLSTFTAEGRSIGGSRVVSQAELDAENDPQYRKIAEPVPKVTLESLMERFAFPRIDILKLDVEGSEFSILEDCDLSKIGTIFIESHGAARWRQLLERRFQGWDIGHMSANGDFENWHLVNPRKG